MSQYRRLSARLLPLCAVGVIACAVLPNVASASPNASVDLNQLSAVSCATITNCQAVGFYYASGSGPIRTLTESMIGTTWTVSSSPDASSLNNQLSGVSCVSPTRCIAVGSYRIGANSNRTLIESWNGSSWSIVTSPHPGSWSFLNSVSCVSLTRCEAVGYEAPIAGGNERTLVESLNGTTWSVTPSPSPSTTYNILNSVSCASATRCKAVGDDYDTVHHRYLTLIESMNGSTWTGNTSSSPGPIGNGLNGVSCPSTTSCDAVGGYNDSLGIGRTLVEHWNGSTWATTPSPNDGALTNALQAVSCATATRCETVGFYSAPLGAMWALSERMIGSAWSLTSSSDNGTQDELFGASCVTTVNCKLSGTYLNAGLSANQTLINSWNGTSSSIM